MTRKIEYLSPSGLALFRKDQEAFYVRYLTEKRLPDEDQTMPMAAGSAFDAYAKSYLHHVLYGKGKDPRFELDALFEAQVQACNRDTSRNVGLYLFEKYKESGALADLLLELQNAVNEPRFEIEVRGVVGGYREGVMESIHGVTLLGKPDLFYMNQHGTSVIVDWKVNGYYATTPKSPMKGYIRLRSPIIIDSNGILGPGIPCRFRDEGRHKDCSAGSLNGTIINLALWLDEVQADWAAQLSIYAWLCGAEVGEEFIVGIDQICCAPSGSPYPQIKIAEHRMRVQPKFQHNIFALAQDVWHRCHSGHFFTDMTLEQSVARCAVLDQQHAGLDLSNEKDRQFYEMTKPHRPY